MERSTVIIAREKFIKVLSRVVTVRWRRDIFILPRFARDGERQGPDFSVALKITVLLYYIFSYKL